MGLIDFIDDVKDVINDIKETVDDVRDEIKGIMEETVDSDEYEEDHKSYSFLILLQYRQLF